MIERAYRKVLFWVLKQLLCCEDLKTCALVGDLVIVTYPKALRREQTEYIRAAWKEAFGGNAPKIAIFDDGAKVSVIS